MKKHIPSIALAAALVSTQAHAFEPFQVRDIRVEGIQRTEAGTVFSYLPVKVGETLTDDKASAAIKALFATGFFKDVRLEVIDGVLIVQIQERPAVAQIDFSGMKEFQKDEIKSGLKQLGLAEGRILDKSMLEKAEQELKRQYFNRGMYAVEVAARTSPLERNRVAVNFEINEGDISKIRSINIIGAKAFKEKDLLDLFALRTPGWMTWWTKNDQYSKQKLTADLEVLRSHYLNLGYLEFTVDSTQVSITPDKQDIYISINVTEGEKYTVSGYKIAGDLPVPEKDLDALVKLKTGDVFSREKLNESVKKMADRLGNDGFAFANVNAAPEIDKAKHQVAFTFLVDPGRKVYVRRIEVAGNNKTQDQVIRREMRQQEGGAYAADKITRSRERIERLGYFSEVNLETPAVPGTTDQVDVNVSVTEKSTGNILLGAGFSSTEGIVLSGSVSQNNLFGTGNKLSVQLNSGSVNTVYALSFTNPYFTPDGVSLGYDIYRRDQDTASLGGIAQYQTSTLGLGGRLGLPINELDSINLGAAIEQYTLDLSADSPNNFKKFATDFGGDATGVTTNSLRLDAGWARDSRNSLLYPTAGSYQRLYGELGTPIGDLEYYKLNYQYQMYWPLSGNLTLMLNGEIGYGGGFGDKPMPFFRNFYAGGNTSVRGFESGTLGPKALDSAGSAYAIGGDKRLVGNAELLFPLPGLGKDRSVRMSLFMDAGAAFGPDDYQGRYSSIAFGDIRYSGGVGFTWYSPFGPLKFSLAKPINAKDDDKTQAFQFQLGSVF
ncbi:MAG: outer membrane protein assembly factor BamA [Betaproteobacteria bacterium]|nr:outer membrane protein assembly factor BamA [Betaproteobacteria bacterium]